MKLSKKQINIISAILLTGLIISLVADMQWLAVPITLMAVFVAFQPRQK